MRITSFHVSRIERICPHTSSIISLAVVIWSALSSSHFVNLPAKLVDVFQDSAEIIFKKTTDGKIICNNAQKLSDNLNKLFGDNIFSKRLAEAGGILNEADEIVDTLDASFDEATAQEMVMTFAYEWLYRRWFYMVHGSDRYDYDHISIAYEGKLSDAPIKIRELKWYE